MLYNVCLSFATLTSNGKDELWSMALKLVTYQEI